MCKSEQPMIYGLSKRELPIGHLGLTTSFLLVVESPCFVDIPVCKSEQPLIYGLSKRELPIGHVGLTTSFLLVVEILFVL